VVRQMFGYVNKDVDETQRENNFHIRCLINNKFCVLIIERGSCTNIASKILIEKLRLCLVGGVDLRGWI